MTALENFALALCEVVTERRKRRREPMPVATPHGFRVGRRVWRQTALFEAPPPKRVVARSAYARRIPRVESERSKARKLALAASDENAVVVIVVARYRDAGERDIRQIPNEPDGLGRVRFTSTGYGKARDLFANLDSWKAHLDGLGRRWRVGP